MTHPTAPDTPADPAPDDRADAAPVQAAPAQAKPDADVNAAPPASLWDRMKDDPQYAPEHLALEAVRRLGPEAHRWAGRVRAARPELTPDGLAEVAQKKFVNYARFSGAVSGAAGLPGAVVDVGVLAWTQARMVLHIAASYGVDPQHPDRATDLLVLQKVHKYAETARVALGVAAGRETAGALLSRSGDKQMGRVLMKLGVRLAQMAGVRAAKRMFAKIVPGAAIILGTWANSSATTELARRTRAHYGVPHQRGGTR